MGSLNLLPYGLVLLGASMAYPLTPHPLSHIHHTRMNERVSVFLAFGVSLNPIDPFVHLQLSQTIPQPQLALHHIPPDQILPRMVV